MSDGTCSKCFHSYRDCTCPSVLSSTDVLSLKKRVKKNKSKKEKNLFAYKFFDGTFHKLFFSRSDNYTNSSFERVPEYDTSEEIE